MVDMYLMLKEKNMRIAVIGSRGFSDYSFLKEKLDELHSQINISLIVSGGARGADTLGEQYAKDSEIKTLIFPADWKKYGKRAGYIRNYDIIKNCDIVVAFWDGESRGTKHSLDLARKQEKEIRLFYV